MPFKDWNKANLQVVENYRRDAAAPGLDAAGKAGAQEHIHRKENGGNYAGKELRAEPDAKAKRMRHQGNRKRHIEVKKAITATAIRDLMDVLPPGQAIASLDAKRGSRAIQHCAG